MNKYDDKIDLYMSGDMAPEEMAEMDKAIAASEHLQSMVRNYAAAKTISQDLLDVDMRSTLDDIQRQELVPHKRVTIRRILAVAAILVLLLGAWVVNNQLAHANISRSIRAESSMKPTSPLPKHRGVISDKSGYDYLNLNQYDKAIEAFKADVGNEKVDQDQLHYALAYAYGVTGNIKLATHHVQQSNLQQARKLEAILTQ